MPASATLTIRLPAEVKGKLGRLSDITHRTSSFLAAEAIAKYVESESRITEGIERGLADAKAGRLVPHAQAVDRLEATIAAAARAIGRSGRVAGT